jgi:hypothetical protein
MERSMVIVILTHENDYNAEFHMANEKIIINI